MQVDIKKIFLWGIFLRLIILPFFFHPDLKALYFHAQFFREGELNIYQFLEKNRFNLPYTNIHTYPPLNYFFLGSYLTIVSPLLGTNFYTWLNNWSATGWVSPGIWYFLFVLKLPFLLFDMLTGLILVSLVKKYSHLALTLWFFNPLSLYAIYVLSNFDIIPAFFVILALYLLRRKPIWSAIFLGLGAGLKTYPLLLLPFFALRCGKNKIEKLIFISISLCTYLLIILPFLPYPSFRESALVSGLTVRLFDQQFLNLPIFPIAYLALLIYFMVNKRVEITTAVFSLLSLLFILINFHFQWIVWLIPWLILLSPKPGKEWILSIGYFGLVLIFKDQFLNSFVASPLNPNLYLSSSFSSFLQSKVVIFETIFKLIFSLPLITLAVKNLK